MLTFIATNRLFPTLLAGTVAGAALGGCASGGAVDREETVGPANLAEAEFHGESEEARAASSVGVDYVMGPDDLLRITIFGAPELSGEMRIDPGGEISVPLLDPITARGRTRLELEKEIEDRLRDSYMWDPRVTVHVLEARSHAVARIYVLGDVRRPGGFPLERGEPISAMQALALAEGLQPTAAKDRARVIRRGANGGQNEVPLNLDRILDGSHEDPLLGHQDVLFVPNSRRRSVVRGAWEAFIRMFTLRGFLY